MRNKVFFLSFTAWIAFSPASSFAIDGEKALLVVEQAAGRLTSVDPKTGRALASVNVGTNPHEIEVSPDGTLAFVSNFGIQDYDETIGTPGKTVSVIDLKAMKELRRLHTGTDAAPHGVKLRPPLFSELFVNVEKGHAVLVFDVRSGRLLRRLPVNPRTHNLLFSKDGSSLLLMAGPSGVIQIDVETGAEIGRLSLSSPARGLAYSPDMKNLLVAGKGELGIFDSKSLQLVKHFSQLGVGQILYATFTPDGSKILAPAVWDSQVLVIDVGSGRVLERIITGLDPVAVVVDENTNRAFVSNARSRHVSCIDLKTYAHEKCVFARGPNGMALGARPAIVSNRRAATKRETISFGVPLPLSGPESYFGREMMLGYEFWKETVNDEGGMDVCGKRFDVDITYRDTKSDNGHVSALGESLAGAGVKFFLGTYNSPANGALASVAQSHGIPLVTSAGAARELYEKNNPWLFGVMAPASEYLRGSIEFAALPSSKVRIVSIVARNAPAPLEDARAARQYAKSLGLDVPSEVFVFPTSGIDFSSLVKEVKAESPDLVLFAGDLFDAEAFVREAATQQFQPKGFSFSVGPSLPHFSGPQGLGRLASYMLGASQWSSEARLTGVDRYRSSKKFAEDFWDRYFTAAHYLPAGAVASGLTFEKALKNACDLNPNRVREKLKALHFDSFYGPISFNENGLNLSKPIYTIQLRPEANERMKDVVLRPFSSGAATWPFPGFDRSKQ